MMTPVLLWLLGLLLIFLEFYIPGSVMGIAGGILVFLSVILFASSGVSPIAAALFFLGVAASVVLLIRFTLWRIRSARPEYSIYSDKAQNEGYVASHYDQSAIGKTGMVLSDLKPGGYILIEGKQHQALSQSGYIVKGCEVKVVGGEGESLIVKLVKQG
jgi:membrane-bound ClpP family serine protease